MTENQTRETKYILWIDICPNFHMTAKPGVAESHI